LGMSGGRRLGVTFEHAEKALSQATGIRRHAFKEVRRELKEGLDWAMEGGKVMFSTIGMQKALRILSPVGEDETEGPALVAKPLEAPPATVQALVWGFPKNTRIMDGLLEGERIRIRVKDRTNFRREMLVPVRQVEGTLYEFAGRYPRRPGRLPA
jgi:hypothetical protein